MIYINNLTTNEIDESFIKNVAKLVLKGENKNNLDLSVVFVGPNRIRQLNKEYLGRNRVTDVLAFPEPQKDILPPLAYQGVGEIVICSREVKKNAKRYKSSYEKELVKVIIHGILHLLGYEHEKSPKKAKIMFAKQEDYLNKWLK